MKKMVLLLALFLIFPLVFFNGLLQADSHDTNVDIPGVIPQAEVQAIACGTGEQVVNHMEKMGDLIGDMENFVNAMRDPELEQEELVELRGLVVATSQRLRTHLAAVFIKNPPKILKIVPDDPAGGKIIFQEYILSVIRKTIEIEELARVDYEESVEIKEQAIRVGATMRELHDIVAGAHGMFRRR